VSLLEVEELEVAFATPRGRLRAVNGLSFAVEAGETLAIVGESGSGKSVAQLALLDLLPPSAEVRSKRVSFDGRALDARALRGRELAIVFQDPLSALHPLLSVGEQLSEVLETHERLARGAARERAIAALAEVGIPAPAERFGAYPHELSGGMRQRVLIAMALLCRPRLVFADEPTTALDVTVQAQVLELLAGLRRSRGMALVLVTHSMGVVATAADRVLVMYAGAACECGPVARVFERPQHPYTRALLASVPDLERPLGAPAAPIPGAPPDPIALPQGCAFAPRCPRASARCSAETPRFDAQLGVACHHPGDG
jgi:oligopeptide/dipeptide ABC transporter ATP-binding protein